MQWFVPLLISSRVRWARHQSRPTWEDPWELVFEQYSLLKQHNFFCVGLPNQQMSDSRDVRRSKINDGVSKLGFQEPPLFLMKACWTLVALAVHVKTEVCEVGETMPGSWLSDITSYAGGVQEGVYQFSGTYTLKKCILFILNYVTQTHLLGSEFKKKIFF